MKEEDKIESKVGRENAFRVPDGYFEHFTSDVMSRLPEKEKCSSVQKPPTKWERMKPWVYMAAMFVGAALIIRVASQGLAPAASDGMTGEEADAEVVSEQYVSTVMDNSMLDDYSLYIYLTDADAE